MATGVEEGVGAAALGDGERRRAGEASGPPASPARATGSSWLARLVWPVLRVLLVTLLAAGLVGNLVAIGVLVLLVDVLHVVAIDFHGKTLETIGPAGSALGLSIVITTNLGLVLLAWRLLERRPFADLLLVGGRAAWRPLAWGLAFGLAEVAAVFGILVLTGGVETGVNDVSLAGVGWIALGWLYASSVAAPLLEETLDRGYWFVNVHRGWGTVAATAVNALLFGGLHLFNPHATLLGALNIALSAVAFVLGMLAFRSLWLPIGWHAGWNLAQFFLAGLPNSGLSPEALGLRSATLLASRPTGPSWLSGGGFGMEGSVAATAVLLLAIAALAAWHARRARELPPPPLRRA